MNGTLSRLRQFFRELKRRKVFQVGTIYLVTAWGATLGAAELFPAFGAPDWSVRVFAVFAALGFPIAVVLAWAFEVTPEGVVRDPGELSHAQTGRASGADASTTALFGKNGTVRVTWSDAANAEQDRSFDDRFVIGREATCAIRFDDPLVSRRHAEVSFAGGLWWVADLGSRNGTLLDGQRITRVVLPGRGVIRLSEGGPLLSVEVHAPENSTTVLAPSPARDPAT